MIRTLYGKLALTLFVVVSLVGFGFLQLVAYSSNLYQQEVAQKLNRELAKNIITESQVLRDGKVDRAAMEEIFHMLMVINPAIELYLLDTAGNILAYSAPENRVRLERVNMQPVRQFLSGDTRFPLRGDDPRDGTRQKVFSVAPIVSNETLQGYMYIILGSEKYDGVAQMLQDSYSMRLVLWGLGAGLLVALLAGLFIFFVLTNRLRVLSLAMTNFARGDIDDRHGGKEASRRPNRYPERTDKRPGDEIDQLGKGFNALADRISEQIRKLENVDSQRRELIANVSHDLRTPVTNLQGYLETLLLKQDMLDPEAKTRYLNIALSQSQRLATLINELFELARLDSCENVVYAEPFSIAEIAQDMVQKFQLKAQHKAIRLNIETGREVPMVYGDISLMHRVLENLLENAIRHTPEGGRVTIGFIPKGDRLVVRVADTGQGIPEAAMDRIFDRFYRGDACRSGNPGSTGLGLAIAKRILELHGSRIRVRSRLDAGTVFSFDMPQAAPR